MIHKTSLSVLLVALSACGSVPPAPEPDPATDALEAAMVRPSTHSLAAARPPGGPPASVEGRSIEVVSLGAGPRTILIAATIHGDEHAGTPLVRELERHLREHPELLTGRRVVLVPVVNPDGFERKRRRNANGVDLNRNFPTANFRAGRSGGPEPLSEPESTALFRLIEEVAPVAAVSIHQPLGCIDYDGPGEELARAMAATCSLPVRRLGANPGSLGSWLGVERGVPIVTLELRSRDHRRDADDLWEEYGEALLAAVCY